MLGFPLQFDATTPRLCKSVLSSASEPAGGSHSGDWFSRLRGIVAKLLPLLLLRLNLLYLLYHTFFFILCIFYIFYILWGE